MCIRDRMYTIQFINRLEADHGTKAAWHEKDTTTVARKEARQKKKRKIDHTLQTEGVTYEPGAF
ncbi:MAG: hypothetical protein MPK62_15520, partial [Alphaproteobacteria bacterium]|nr:hypothetical protein [Alphaproteobacteria bacterium]